MTLTSLGEEIYSRALAKRYAGEYDRVPFGAPKNIICSSDYR